MTSLLRFFVKLIDNLNEQIGRATTWLTTILVLVFCYDVLMRYVFDASSVAMFELEWHLFSIIFLMGAGYTLKHDRHVRVDVFYAKFSPSGKAWVNLLGVVFFLIPFCIIIFKGAIPYIALSLRIDEGSSDAGGLPHRYIIKTFMFLGFFFLMLQGFAVFCKSLLVILGDKVKGSSHHLPNE
ncbi:MAG: TRAP transporter small permease subunit [Cytophagales bacterium]|nr:MAG: TRAP transporter small permease subunit [Cytophagales bacterium]